MHLLFKATGTTWKIDSLDSLNLDQEGKIGVAVRDRIETFEKTYSRFRDDSIVGQMAKNSGEYIFPEDAEPMLKLYEDIYHLTGGLVTPLIGQVLSEVGYDAKYSLTPHSVEGQIAKAKKWPEVLEVKYSEQNTILIAKEPVMLDFGAFGKGYIIDIVSNMLKQFGLRNFTVDAGGDISHFSEMGEAEAIEENSESISIRVGLENPDDFNQVIGVANIGNQSICGSSGNRRKWGNHHHIINPETTQSPRHIKAVWAVADTTMLADAMTTVLFFIEPKWLEKIRKKYKFEYAIVWEDGSSEISECFPGNFFT